MADIGQKRPFTIGLRGANRVMSLANLHAHMCDPYCIIMGTLQRHRISPLTPSGDYYGKLRLATMKTSFVKSILAMIGILSSAIALGSAPQQPGGAYHINYLGGGKYERSAKTIYIPVENGINYISFNCNENTMSLGFTLDEMVDYQWEVKAYFEFPDGSRLQTNGAALDGISIENNKSSSGKLRLTDRLLEKISTQARMSVRIAGRLRSKDFEQSLSGAGKAISLSRQWCLGESQEAFGSGSEKPSNDEQLGPNETVSTAKNMIGTIDSGNSSFTSKTRNYFLKEMALNDAESSRIYALMSTKPAITTDHPDNSNNNFRNIEISGTSKDGNSELKINNTVILMAPENKQNSIVYTSSLKGEDELLLVGVYEGGNSCITSKQLLVALKPNGKYFVSSVFGRCNPLIYHDSNVTYFVYAPDEYRPMKILSLTSTPKI